MASLNPHPEPILLFLDIEGVLSVVERATQEVVLNEQGFGIYPVPGAKQFLQALDSAYWIKVMWISSHGKQAQLVNDWAGTIRWPTAYRLSWLQEIFAHWKFADSRDVEKLLLIRWHSRQWAKRIVWIEDGFPDQAHIWAAEDDRVQLVDTRPIAYPGTRYYWPSGIRTWNASYICRALDLSENLPLD